MDLASCSYANSVPQLSYAICSGEVSQSFAIRSRTQTQCLQQAPSTSWGPGPLNTSIQRTSIYTSGHALLRPDLRSHKMGVHPLRRRLKAERGQDAEDYLVAKEIPLQIVL